MSSIQELKEYLIKDNNSFLVSDDNNGKVIMISGVWGSGKTFFWKNEIVNNLEKPNIYISLYGKDSIDSIQQELFMKVLIKNNKDVVSKTFSIFSFLGRSISAFGVNGKQFFEDIESLNEKIKNNKALEILSKGEIIICFDDFERKSTKIDLHDLFGFITQLAIEFKCKLVVILNEDLFKGKDAEIFSRVKEKTVNKFIEFKPTIEDLFNTIYKSNDKYSKLAKCKDTILSSIKEIDELNARTYFQILDNCLEYYIQNDAIENKQIRTLSIATSIFTNHNVIFSPSDIQLNVHDSLKIEYFTELPEFLRQIFQQVFGQQATSEKVIIQNKDQLFEEIKNRFTKGIKMSLTAGTSAAKPDEILKPDLDFIQEKLTLLWLIYFYCFKIDFKKNITNDELIKINNFIKQGF